jgi:hypothetical protein
MAACGVSGTGAGRERNLGGGGKRRAGAIPEGQVRKTERNGGSASAPNVHAHRSRHPYACFHPQRYSQLKPKTPSLRCE